MTPFLICVVASTAQAQYSTLFLPDSLKKDARMIKRLDEVIYEIKSPGKAVEHEHHVYTVLNSGGGGYGDYRTSYGKFNSINYVNGFLYDAFGKEIKRFKKKDMADQSESDEETLMTDERSKEYDFGYSVYPYTVDFEEEDDINGILALPNWGPQNAPGISVENSKFIIIAPKGYLVRYKAFNYKSDPVITEQGDKKIYTWEIKNLTAKKNEVNAPSWREIVPYVMMAPSDFEAQGYKGNMNTWQDYGKFIYDLLQGRDVLPDEIKRKVHELADGLNDPYEKVYALYDFLQKNTRYISIQLGIGGLQPFDANFVATKRYGDCKALSNYLVAMLKEVGVKGYSVVINAGKDALPVADDFPSDQFDHVIACVPINKDTLWLECTSQTKSPGFMGSFTGNRKALLINETGGYLVNTPTYTAKENVRLSKVNAVIDIEGNLDASLTTSYSGILEELPHALIYDATKDQREKYLNNVLNLPTYQVDKNDYSEKKGKLPVVTETLHLTSPGYASVSGKRLFLAPNLFNKSQDRLSVDSTRKYPIDFQYGYCYIDSISLKIPQGYAQEAVPKNVNIKSKFGTYNMTISIDGGIVNFVRYLENNTGHFTPADYPELVKFYDDMYKADRSKIVFVKKDS